MYIFILRGGREGGLLSQAPRTQKLQLLAALALTMGAPASAWRDEGMPRRALGLGSARGRVEKLKWVALLEQGCKAAQQRKTGCTNWASRR